MSEVGEIHKGMSVEWKIPNFNTISKEVGEVYLSPVFRFSDSSWLLSLYPNGETSNSSSEDMSLLLVKKDSGPPKTVSYTLGIKDSDGIIMNEEVKWEFSEEDEEYGWIDFFGSDWRKEKSKFWLEREVTIICDIKKLVHCKAEGSVDGRRGNLIRDMKSILTEGKRSDFTLKLGTREWPVHKIILESRSEYFANMFRHAWVENTVGEVRFDDVGEDALKNVLHFIYTCEVDCVSQENVCEIYVAAHKFLLEDLKKLCIEYMKKNLCVDTACRVLAISKTYDEEDLHALALEYFVQKADKILGSEEWKQFKKNNLSLAADLMEDVTLREIKKRIQE